MKIKQAIQLGNNITDIFNLPCVRTIMKMRSGNYVVFLEINEFNTQRPQAFKGDWLCQYDNGKWFPLTDRQYQNRIDKL